MAAVGQVIVDPEWDDPSLPESLHYTDRSGDRRCAGAVRLLIIDSNGMPANQQILDAVYIHIAGTGDDDPERLMPIGAHLTVGAPKSVTIDIDAEIQTNGDADIETVTESFKRRLADYWLTVGQEAAASQPDHTGHVRLVQIGAALAKTSGVLDYTGLTVNGGTDNVAVTQAEYPVTGEVTLHAQARP